MKSRLFACALLCALAVSAIPSMLPRLTAAGAVTPVRIGTYGPTNTPGSNIVGIDWMPGSANLLVTRNWLCANPTTLPGYVPAYRCTYEGGGYPDNFGSIATTTGAAASWGLDPNGGPVRGWQDEIYFASVRPGQGATWRVGDVFSAQTEPAIPPTGYSKGSFGSRTQIARFAADGTLIKADFATLPGELKLKRGAVIFDRYGVAGGDLIVVAANDENGPSTVYRIASTGTGANATGTVTTLVASYPGHLEGVTTVPNLPQYGPWAGRIIAGLEFSQRIATINPDTGVVERTDALLDQNGNPVKVEDMWVVPADHDFYGVDFPDIDQLYAHGDLNYDAGIWKIDASQLTPYVGKILIAQEYYAPLFVVEWNGAAFKTTRIFDGWDQNRNGTTPGHWEHITFVPRTAVTIQKLTNGVEANDPDAAGVPNLAPGDAVTWTYRVTNTGTVSIAKTDVQVTDNTTGVVPVFDHVETGNADDLLEPGEVWVYVATGTALDLTAPAPTGVTTVMNSCTAGNTQPPRTAYVNTGTVTVPGPVSAQDTSSYCNPPVVPAPAISLVKLTNGTDNDSAPGVTVLVGSTVTWTYQVANTGNVTLTNVTVTDDKQGLVCTIPSLAAGASTSCTASGIAQEGQYTNVGTVTGTPPSGPNVTAANPDNYNGYRNVTIGNFVWNDLNHDGVQDAGEPGIQGVTLTLTGTDFQGHAVNATTTTDASGSYSFTEPPGTYTVSVTTPSGYLPTVTGKGTTSTDSNPSPSGTTPATLASGASDDTLDFGFYQSVTIGNFVWNDLNGNGVQDPGEPGIAGVTLTLTGTDGAGNAVSDTTTTDATGAYSFSEAPGTYVVSVTTPAGYMPTATGKGTTATDSNATPSGTTPTALPGGGADDTIDFGFYQPVVIGNFVWNDTNANGIQDAGEPGIPGVTVTLTGTTGAGLAVSLTTTTDANGAYSFTAPPGTYSVAVTSPAGYTPTLTGKGTTATDSNSSPSGTTPTTLAGGSSDATIDFGFYRMASIGDYVWLDLNGNGQQDSGETGLSGVPVRLFDATGTTLLQSTTTNATGYYSFSVQPGTYIVEFSTGAGYDRFTVANSGADTTDSDANTATGRTGPITVASGQTDNTNDAGLLPIDLSLTKTVNSTSPNVGQDVTFTITVANATSASTATGVTVSDVLPTGLSFVSATPNQGSYNSTTGVWTIGTLAPGASVTLSLTATVTSSGTKTNYAQVQAADQPDVDSTPGNNSTNEDDDDSVSVTPPQIDLSLTKRVNNTTPTVGSNVTFTITVSNAGPNTATTVTVRDVLPAGLTYVSSSATQGSYNSSTGIWTIGTMSAGGSASLSLVATVTTTGTKTNYAQVQAADQPDVDSVPGNNSTTEDDDDQVSLTPTNSPYTTYTIGGWGAPPNGKNPATLLAAYFKSLYSKGLIVGGSRTLALSGQPAVQYYMPDGGTPGVLLKSYKDPITTESGVFGSQVVALKLNVDFSNAGILPAGLGKLKVAAGYPLAGYTVTQVLAVANSVLGGGSLPAGQTVSSLNYLVTVINQNYDNSTQNLGVLVP